MSKPVKRALTGTVVSNKMDKTIVVNVKRRFMHSLYKRVITRSKRYKAHDEENTCQIGDIVRIGESRPISKDKRWQLIEIVERAEK